MWWHTVTHGRRSEGETGEWSGLPVPFTLLWNMVYPALLQTIKADAHTSAASSQLNWLPRQFKWTPPFRQKMKSGLCACVITFQLASTTHMHADVRTRIPSYLKWVNTQHRPSTLWHLIPLVNNHSCHSWSIKEAAKIFANCEVGYILCITVLSVLSLETFSLSVQPLPLDGNIPTPHPYMHWEL